MRYRGLRGSPKCNEGPREARELAGPVPETKTGAASTVDPECPAAASNHHIRQTGPSSRLDWGKHCTWQLIPDISPVSRLLASSYHFHRNHYPRFVSEAHHDTKTDHHPRAEISLITRHPAITETTRPSSKSRHHQHPKSTPGRPAQYASDCQPGAIHHRQRFPPTGRDLPLSRTPDTQSWAISGLELQRDLNPGHASMGRTYWGHTHKTHTHSGDGGANRDAGKKTSCLAPGTQSLSRSRWSYRAG